MNRIIALTGIVGILLSAFYVVGCNSANDKADLLSESFIAPPDSARPGVYWYFMDGNVTKEAITKDLESMKEVGIGYVVYLEVNVGVPRGKVEFFSPEWQDLFGYAVKECERLGIYIVLGIGPGWNGSGGPWVEGALSMQHLVYTTTELRGAGRYTIKLPKPEPRRPFFGEGSFAGTPALQKWHDFYEDVAVLAVPSGATMINTGRTPGQAYSEVGMRTIDEKALYYRRPYSSADSVRQYLPLYEDFAARPEDKAIAKTDIIDLTGKMKPDGTLEWDAPAGQWTVMRFGARNNGAATRPAPIPGVGFESDKFDTTAIADHLDKFTGQLFRHIGFKHADPKGGLQMLHIDSWEMGAQNWSPSFREEFQRRRGYDPLPFYPVYAGIMVQSREISERFLWDLRQTAQELVVENHIGYVRRYAHKLGMGVSCEPYDMTPLADLELAVASDMPMCEFWSLNMGCNTSYSPGEGASAAHLIGQPVVPAEAFTAAGDTWLQHPASIKNEGEWAYAAGINRFMYHTFQHQCLPDGIKPGMTMGPYGVHWDRNQTWWPMAGAYHRYVARSQYMLQQGRTVADVLYLAPEMAPYVFRAPESAYLQDNAWMPDRRGYNFDGCPPSMLFKATVKDGSIVFPSGASYRIMVMPNFKTMTPAMLAKIESLVSEGATVVGLPPMKAPGLANYPACDEELQQLAKKIWGEDEAPDRLTARSYGKGRVFWGKTLATEADNLYPAYEVTAAILREKTPEDFSSVGDNVRYTHRTLPEADIWFVSNRRGKSVDSECSFRMTGRQPELWHPVTGAMYALPQYSEKDGQTVIPLKFAANESYFIVFRKNGARKATTSENFPALTEAATLKGAWNVAFDPKWGGPASVTFDQLSDWSQNANEGIKYYSGTAVYKQTFDASDIKGRRIILDLGTVKNMARVKLNGKDLGVVWTAPWQVDVTDALKAQGNELEIEVVNLWANRLIGDEQLPYDGIKNGQWPEWLTQGKPRTSGRYTFTTTGAYRKDSPLLSSGLLGPVRLLVEQK